MNKKIVREYDTIICNKRYQNDTRYVYIDEKNFHDLTNFIREFTNTQSDTDILDLLRIGYNRHVGDTITFKSYVGIIQLKDGFQLEILPKIDLSEDQKYIHTKKILLKMLRSMKDFPSKVFTEANLQIDKMNLYEIFIHMYIQEVSELVKKGIKSSYVEREDNLNYFKGKLVMKEQLRYNMIHKERFYVSYEDFLPDTPENRLLKSALMKLKSITTSSTNSKEIYQLLTYFERVNLSLNYDQDFSKITINRNNKAYETALIYSKVFLYNKSFSIFSGDTKARALLFPMESVYESYVAREMKKVMIPHGWNVSSQDQSYYLFKEPKNIFALRPDIVVSKGNTIIIMDTKWKKLVNNSKASYNIKQPDMYQMYAYSKKYHTPYIYLLYPLTNDFRKHTPIEFDSGDGTNIKVWFIDLENIKDNLEALLVKIESEGD